MSLLEEFLSQYGPLDPEHPRNQAALAELKEMISRRFPTTTYTVTLGDSPLGIYLTPIVDVDDLDGVADVFMARLVEIQVDEGLSIYVVPDLPPERVKAQLREKQRMRDDGLPSC